MKIAQTLKREDIDVAVKVLRAFSAYSYSSYHDEDAKQFEHIANLILYRGEIPDLKEGDRVRLQPMPYMTFHDPGDPKLPLPQTRYAIIKNGRAVETETANDAA